MNFLFHWHLAPPKTIYVYIFFFTLTLPRRPMRKMTLLYIDAVWRGQRVSANRPLLIWPTTQLMDRRIHCQGLNTPHPKNPCTPVKSLG